MRAYKDQLEESNAVQEEKGIHSVFKCRNMVC